MTLVYKRLCIIEETLLVKRSVKSKKMTCHRNRLVETKNMNKPTIRRNEKVEETN